MKRNWLFVFLILLLLPLTTSLAHEPEGIAQASKVAYGDAQIFFAVRLDEPFVDTLQSLADRIMNAVTQAGLPAMPVNLRDAIGQSLAPLNLTYADLRAAVGDYVAMSVQDVVAMGADPTAGGMLIALQVHDRAALEKLLAEPLSEATERGVEGEYTVYENPSGAGIIALSDTLLLITNSPEIPDLRDPLAANADFHEAIHALPAGIENYNALVYVDLQSIVTASGMADLTTAYVTDFGELLVGLTILEETALVIDTVQTSQSAPDYTLDYTAVNPDFLRFVPAGTDALIQGTNLAEYYRLGGMVLRAQAAMQGEPDPVKQIEGLFLMLGIDLNEDLLNWATGDFALFMDINSEAIFSQMNNATPQFSEIPFSTGLLLEATDSAAAAAFAEKFTQTLKTATANQQGNNVTIGSATLNGVTVTNISAPLMPDLNLEIMIGASEEVFFIATSNAAQNITSGGKSVLEDAAFQRASAYFLPEPAQVWYTNDEGLAWVTVIPTLALIGPAVGSVYEEIIRDLEAPPPSTSPRKGQPREVLQVGQPDPTQSLIQILGAFNALIDHSSITTTQQDGITISRIVLTLE